MTGDSDEQKKKPLQGRVHGGTTYLVHVHTKVEWVLSIVNNRRHGRNGKCSPKPQPAIRMEKYGVIRFVGDYACEKKKKKKKH
jgi:hypothetical protein